LIYKNNLKFLNFKLFFFLKYLLIYNNLNIIIKQII